MRRIPCKPKRNLSKFIRSSQKEHGILMRRTVVAARSPGDADKPVPVVHDQPYVVEWKVKWHLLLGASRQVFPRFYGGGGYHVLPPRYPTPMAPYSCRETIWLSRPSATRLCHAAATSASTPSSCSDECQLVAAAANIPSSSSTTTTSATNSLSNLHAVYGGQKDVPAGNSIYHAFSDDNAAACSIMLGRAANDDVEAVRL
uniref:Uncharacterized protein n=1 Tax=Salix viminalis TaxID=40686 RepID=A0A6N2KBF2_SALVM